MGYDVSVFYLWLASPDLAVARVRRRVEEGGHDVPEAVIRRRFGRSLVNFDRLYRPKVAAWRLYDGGALEERSLVAEGKRNEAPIVRDAGLWKAFRTQVEAMT